MRRLSIAKSRACYAADYKADRRASRQGRSNWIAFAKQSLRRAIRRSSNYFITEQLNEIAEQRLEEKRLDRMQLEALLEEETREQENLWLEMTHWLEEKSEAEFWEMERSDRAQFLSAY